MLYRRSPSEINRQRSQRHQKLMKMIHSYKRTIQQQKKLERIKENTVMEINLRYIKSEHNRCYKFPKNNNPQSDDQHSHQLNSQSPSTYYNLMSQNNQNKQILSSQKIVSYQLGQRVKSLDREKDQIQTERISRVRIKNKQGSQQHFRKFTINNRKNILSGTKLPKLKFKRENVKTQQKIDNELKIISALNKKLITQQQQHTQKGVQIYLKKYENNQSKRPTQRRYLQR